MIGSPSTLPCSRSDDPGQGCVRFKARPICDRLENWSAEVKTVVAEPLSEQPLDGGTKAGPARSGKHFSTSSVAIAGLAQHLSMWRSSRTISSAIQGFEVVRRDGERMSMPPLLNG